MFRRNNRIKSSDLTKYIAECQGLEADYVGEIVGSRRFWKRFGLFGLVVGVAGVSVAGYQYTRPPAAPVVLVYDSERGSYEVLTTIDGLQMKAREAGDLGEIYRYVLDRESYDWYTIQTTYELTGLKSEDDVALEYKKAYEGNQSREKVLGKNLAIVPEVVSIDIRRITPEGGDALVRFRTQLRDKSNGTAKEWQYYATTVAYKYSTAEMSYRDRMRNSSGFRMVMYRPSLELHSK
ncbi:VirB8/TrbF family protein [Achromobacter ruhlandii]|uniref:VirB8/TrbF family protein n=1 Tax=Achromobacter ruhlandii TaxID=72557 RepID=UPI003B9E9074